MRLVTFWVIMGFLTASPAGAKTKVDVSPIENSTRPGPCNLVEPWKKDIEDNFKYQIANALNESGGFDIVESELMRGEERAKLFDSGVSTRHKKTTFKASQYSIRGNLKTFDLCDKKAEVVLEIQVVQNSDGSVAQRFVSKGHARNRDGKTDFLGAPFNTGLFKDSAIGRATVSAISDATAKIKKAFPDRELASDDYKIRTIPRHRAR